MRLLALFATTALALAPMAAEAGTRTIGLHTAPPVLTTGIAAGPMIKFTAPLVTLPAAPPIVGEGGGDEGTPANDGGSDPGTPSTAEEEDSPFTP